MCQSSFSPAGEVCTSVGDFPRRQERGAKITDSRDHAGKSCEASGARDRDLEGQRRGMNTEESEFSLKEGRSDKIEAEK